MTEVWVLCEGQTEASVVNRVLAPHFNPQNIFIKTGLNMEGNFGYERFKTELGKLLKQRKTGCVTTWFDFYGLKDAHNFPGYQQAKGAPTAAQKRQLFLAGLEAKLKNDLSQDLSRLILNVQMHELEALLFVDPNTTAQALCADPKAAQALATALAGERGQLGPEELNDNPQTAPSKRIIALHPTYAKAKPRLGTLAIQQAGLAALRGACPLFDGWLRQLEGLGPGSKSVANPAVP